MIFANLRSRFYTSRMLRAKFAGKQDGLEAIESFLRKNHEVVRAPMILISQVQRSGGSLLSQLFDGHPQIAAMPDELRIGYPTDDDWPPIDPALGAHKNFLTLFETKISRRVSRGYTKGGRDEVVHPFFLIPRLQHQLFLHLFDATRPQSARDVLDLYFTSYFNAWLNYSTSLAEKKWVAAFAPRMADNPDAVASFFRDYPDGRLIQILREPANWYPSARNHRTTRLRDKSANEVLQAWLVSAQAMVRNSEKYSDKVIILRFEDLVGATERTARSLASLLSIRFESSLTAPSYLGRPMLANTSFVTPQSGVIAAPLRRNTMLSDDERALIESTCRDAYRQAVSLAIDVSSHSQD